MAQQNGTKHTLTHLNVTHLGNDYPSKTQEKVYRKPMILYFKVIAT
jgi:hypothetical protein